MFQITSGWTDELNKKMKPVQNLFFEDHHLTVSELKRWKKTLPKRKWNPVKKNVESLRLLKTEVEQEHLRTAAQLGDKVLAKVLPHIKPGVTELQISNLFRQYSFELADGISFDPIVAFGKNGAVPHHHPGDTKLKKNDVVLIDQGVCYKGYMSDMTRCFYVGKGVLKVTDMYHQLLQVQEAAVNMVRPGVNIQQLAKAVRAMLGKDDAYFTHSLGHGVGLEVHEAPGVSHRSNTILEAGMVITIEPGLYKASVGGVRIEDTVIVNEDGCEVITKSSKKYKKL